MGSVLSRSTYTNSNPRSDYTYPPKSGNYFGRYFIMGGRLYETIQPECFLFGDNEDLNFLASKPAPFNYPLAQDNTPTRALRALVNIRKDSLKLEYIRPQQSVLPESETLSSVDRATRSSNANNQNRNQTSMGQANAVTTANSNALITGASLGDSSPNASSPSYHIQFTLDADSPCEITVYYFAREEVSDRELKYYSRDNMHVSRPEARLAGTNQHIVLKEHIFEPGRIATSDDDWASCHKKGIYPIVIHCRVTEEKFANHSHALIATIERNTESSDPSHMYSIKLLKQKQFIEGCLLILQEIYGIENKVPVQSKPTSSGANPPALQAARAGGVGESSHAAAAGAQQADADTGMECVICMSEPRDTLIVPCRHLCLCAACAKSLRNQAPNCPICRSPFRALLQIRSLRKQQPAAPENAYGYYNMNMQRSLRPQLSETDQSTHYDDNGTGTGNGTASDDPDSAVPAGVIPPGYEAVSLVEALNGVSCLPGPGRASSRSVRSSGRGGARGPEAPSPSNGLGLGVQPPQRSASALTAGSYGTGTETYATIGPGASIINGLPYKEVPERGGRESVNTAAATGTGSIVSSIAASARACHRATTDVHDVVEYYPEDQQTRSGSPAVSQFTETIFPGDESTHAAIQTDALSNAETAETNSEVAGFCGRPPPVPNHHHIHQTSASSSMAPPSARGPSSRNQPAAEQPKRMTAAQLSNARAAAAADAARYSKVRTVPTAAAARIPQSKEGVGLTAAARTQAQVAVDSRTGTLGSQASNVTVVPGSGYQQPMQADQVDVSITGAGNKDADTEHISARSHPKPQHSTPGAGLSTPGVGVGVGASQSETAQAAAQHVELARSVSNDSEGTTPYSVATDEPNAPSNSDDYYSDGIGLDGALPGPHGPMPGHYSQCGLGHPAGASDYPYAGAGPVPLNMVPIPAAVQMGSQITSTTCQIITAQIIQPQPNLPPTLVFSTITQQQVAAANYIQQTVPMSVIPMYPGQPQAADPSYYVPGHSGYVPAPPDPTNDAAGHSPFGNANARASRHSAAAGPQPRAHQHMPPPMRPSQNQRSVPAPPDEADADESLSCAASDGGAGPYSLSEYSDGPSPATVLDESLNPNSDLPAPKMQTPSSK